MHTMMSVARVRELIRAGASDSLRACADALDAHSVSEVGDQPGTLAAAEALATFSIRRTTAKAAGIEIVGFDDLLQALSALGSKEQVLIFSFSGTEFVFSVFADPQRDSLLGCLRIRKRDGKAMQLV